MTTSGDRPSQEHIQIERHLIDTEVELAKSLQQLGEVEGQLGMKGDSDHRLEQAAEQNEQAKRVTDTLSEELKEEQKRRNKSP